MDPIETSPILAQKLSKIVDAIEDAGGHTFIVRGADTADLRFTFPSTPDETPENQVPALVLYPPHPLIMLVTFTQNDGGEEGIQNT